MCKKTFTHYMHHDARIPIITDLKSDNPPVYADTRHTRWHQCELTRPPPGTWMLNSPYPPCMCHSCCVCITDIDFCSEFCAELACYGIEDPYAEDCKPEECIYFRLEQHHVQLEYLGQPEAYSVSIPATWREDIQEEECDWSRLFNRDQAELGDWELRLFSEYGTLYLLEHDAKTHFSVYCDLIKLWPPGHPNLLIAERNVEEAQTKVIMCKESISGLIDWARACPFAPEPKFIPNWQVRMRKLKDEVYKE
ncbi:hypothetical protein F4776DRAFT_497247 [Hypoxylon sp. NC0597]|nr:hypothetical protein F4776DRAFT_497247 [Hypoxylon sp. NC0597]